MNRILNITHWPISIRIAVLVGIGVLALALPAFLLVRQASLEVSLDNGEQIVQSVGGEQREEVDRVLDRAQELLDVFSNDNTYRNSMLAVLTDETGSATGDNTTTALNALLTRQLLAPSTSDFVLIRLYDPSGFIVGAASAETALAVTLIGSLENRSTVFLSAVEARAGGQSKAILLGESDNGSTVEVMRVISQRDGSIGGYLVAQVDTSALENALIVGNLTYPINSALVSNTERIVAGVGSSISAFEVSDGVARALEGSTGIGRYSLPSGTEVLGYYSSLGDIPFVLVSEIPIAAIEELGFSYFTNRAFVLVAGFTALGSVLAALLFMLNQSITPPILRLRKATLAMAQGDFSVPLTESGHADEIGALASSFVVMREQVNTLVNELQGRLEARARDIDTTQEISRFAATQQDVQTLMNKVVSLITERFPNIYHAQIFLLDPEKQVARLHASTGDAGTTLLERGHQLAVGSVSVVGQAVEQKRVLVARDTAYSQVHQKNELLPNTRAELAVPLFFGEDVIGVLDVQSTQRDTFTPEQIGVLQIVANQVAVAIRSAQLYEESRRRLAQIESINRTATANAWRDYLRDQRVRSLTSQAGAAVDMDIAHLRAQALKTGQPAVGEPTERNTIPVAIPIVLAGEPLGTVEWEVRVGEFTRDRLELARELASRLAISLDNARLFQESRRAVERERLVNDISTRLTAQSTVQDILQTAVREVGQALRAPRVTIRLENAEVATNGNGHDNGSHYS
jgi:GAF domain-containing protein/HAMP domain-containing protein